MFHSINTFFMSVIRQEYTDFRSNALKFTDRDGRKRILFAFIILQKYNVLLLFWVHTDKQSLQIQKMHYSYLYDQNDEVF